MIVGKFATLNGVQDNPALPKKLLFFGNKLNGVKTFPGFINFLLA
jgi:hypothetical protein